jgi:hypothetical protein
MPALAERLQSAASSVNVRRACRARAIAPRGVGMIGLGTGAPDLI